jgi:hypothetical protein
MTMTSKELTHSVLLSLANVLLFLGLAYKVDWLTIKYAPFVIVAGAAVLYWRNEIANKIPIKVGNLVVIQSIGFILLFLGFKTYISQYLQSYWVWYLVIGVLLFCYAPKIAKLISKDDAPVKSEEMIL